MPKSPPKDLIVAQELIYKPSNFPYSKLKIQSESSEYGAAKFEMNGLNILFRVAKTTPTKTGQFVTLWKRIENRPIQPFDISDTIDLFVISTRLDQHFGQFVFPKSALIEHDIVASNGKGGKRAIRVYPPWDETTSRQAQKTQNWQLKYFLNIGSSSNVNLAQAKKLYNP